MATFSVNTNLASLKAQNEMGMTQVNMNRTLERLSTGLRINSAADDAAGLAIAENLRADVTALNQGIRNANEGINVINIVDSALGEVGNLLNRAVTLAEQAASSTSGEDSSVSKEALNDEYNEILSEIDRISDTIEFNGQSLLGTASDGSAGASMDIQVGLGSGSNDRLTITTQGLSATSTSTNLGSGALGLGDANDARLLAASNAQAELVEIQDAISNVNDMRGDLGAKFNRLEHTIEVLNVQSESLTASESSIRDADMAQEVVNMTKFQVLNQAGLASLSQANATSQSVLSLLG
jgi:flagellin